MPARAELESRLERRVARHPVLRAVRDAAAETGVPAWLVGGYVRDTALGRPVKDVDLAAGPSASRLVTALRATWGQSGFRFRKRGVTTWRFRVDGRDADIVDAGRRGIEDELRRRELTINAVAFSLTDGRLRDPTGGLRDLRARRLRLPRRGVIREDPLRALRIARFLSLLPSFELARGVAAEAASVARGLRRCSVERVRDELDALLASHAPRRGLDWLQRTDLVDAILPELAPMRRCIAGRDRPDVWHHTLDALAASERTSRLPGAPSMRDPAEIRVLRWALLLHDIAKPDTFAVEPGGKPTFHGHEVLGARRADGVLRRLRQSRELRRRTRKVVLHHLRPHHLADAGAPPRGMRRLVREAGGDLPVLLIHAACDARASGAPDAARRWRRLRRVLVELETLHERRKTRPAAPLIGGRDVIEVLGIAPGPEIGGWLDRARERQDDGRLKTRADALAWLRRQRRSRGARRP